MLVRVRLSSCRGRRCEGSQYVAPGLVRSLRLSHSFLFLLLLIFSLSASPQSRGPSKLRPLMGYRPSHPAGQPKMDPTQSNPSHLSRDVLAISKTRLYSVVFMNERALLAAHRTRHLLYILHLYQFNYFVHGERFCQYFHHHPDLQYSHSFKPELLPS